MEITQQLHILTLKIVENLLKLDYPHCSVLNTTLVDQLASQPSKGVYSVLVTLRCYLIVIFLSL